jgi:hypothetical protein
MHSVAIALCEEIPTASITKSSAASEIEANDDQIWAGANLCDLSRKQNQLESILKVKFT